MSFTPEIARKLRRLLAEGGEFFVFGPPGTDGSRPRFVQPGQYKLTPWPGTESGPMQVCRRSTVKTEYLASVRRLIDTLRIRGGKTVISRVICGEFAQGRDIVDIAAGFFEAYPTCYRTFLFTQATQGWLGASPELLYDFSQGCLQSMALAGTRMRPTQPQPWDAKNTHEHLLVADHVAGAFTQAGIRVARHQPESLPYGAIEHMLTRFEALSAVSPDQLRAFREAMFPTPAVGGFPSEVALDEIRSVESHQRYLYGGLINITDTALHKDLCIVNLRCMHFDHTCFCIYGGGGITAGSDPEAEWAETDNKTALLRRLTMG